MASTVSQSLFSILNTHSAISHKRIENASLHLPKSLDLKQSIGFSKSQLQLRDAHKTHITNCTPNGNESSKPQTPIELQYPAFPTVVDINKIREILPHCFPFLLVDRVVEYNPGVSVVAIKNVTINEDFFSGHFPERPIMPGVLIVESMAQVGVFIILNAEVGGSRENFHLAGIDKVRFRKPVIAGDTLVMRMTIIKLQKRFGLARIEGKAYVGDDVVCEGEFLIATGDS